MKDRAADWAKLAHRGHELANHTVSHPCDLQDQSVVGFRAKEIDPLENWLRNVEGTKRACDYAYLCDVTNLGSGVQTSRRTLMRTCWIAPGSYVRGRAKVLQIHSNGQGTPPIGCRRLPSATIRRMSQE